MALRSPLETIRRRPRPEVVKRRRMKAARGHAADLATAFKLRMKADYGSDDLTGAAGKLRLQVDPVLTFARDLVARAGDE